jgi:hypothetical protein
VGRHGAGVLHDVNEALVGQPVDTSHAELLDALIYEGALLLVTEGYCNYMVSP